jgi:hypothetical protein
MAMATTRNRIERLENQTRPASRMRLDFSALPDADLEFIESIGRKIEPADGGKPDLSRLSIPELCRLREIVKDAMIEIQP